MARAEYNFHHRFRVRYSEIDGQSIVFNGHYLTYFDCRRSPSISVRWPTTTKSKRKNQASTFTPFAAVVEFKAPVYFDEEIDVCVKTGRIGRSSVRFDFEVHGKDQEDLRTTGEIVWVYTNQETHKTEPVDPRLVLADGRARRRENYRRCLIGARDRCCTLKRFDKRDQPFPVDLGKILKAIARCLSFTAVP